MASHLESDFRVEKGERLTMDMEVVGEFRDRFRDSALSEQLNKDKSPEYIENIQDRMWTKV